MKSTIYNMLSAVCIGSFMYLLYLLIFAADSHLRTGQVISVWIASAAIGASTAIRHTHLSFFVKFIVIQLGVTIVAFSIVNFYHGWINMSLYEALDYVLFTIFVMIILSITNYLLSVRDSKAINQALNGDRRK